MSSTRTFLALIVLAILEGLTYLPVGQAIAASIGHLAAVVGGLR